ncbi:MAG: glycine betaine/L-proline ABC transporter ATP-binding protein ProV [Desulfuromonadales bacterium]|jgi:glycine betaine/proline transport system ATP-binding protein|nr:glycine betaine/L-proline ABC transporter ATP-binding protein ProV [Desulfuromonadales bacterium]MDH3868190.1 glycine betaine/L-proline ABC transporter ATP-binding protein ProV [Desulfuromonadales bacterium]MDH3960050.1 glycine betaine/L-proline ABC transporter ATP-binding protein ProV [Desulfuromonadales bacterium]MDH4024425.1 glycine betaine/L-proline ABC transporter ATP-binding protein ProV [Desulfuromonadales bacterium]
MSQEVKVSVKNLFKIFGPHPKKALGMLEQGLAKEEIFEKTETTIGVQNASFEIYTGEIFVIMGLSGSGKSTMVRMINRLIEPTVGQVFIDNEDIVSMTNDELVKMRRKKMSMVFQSFALMPHMTVLQNAAFGLEMDGIDKQTREARALEALEQVGLEAWAGSMPDELSGGMQQRVGLARGLAVDPDILLMDEAFSALDPLIRTEMQDELLKLQAKAKRTIVFISHDLDEAMRIGDRIAIMEGGSVVQVGTPEEILQNPADDYVRAFFRGVDPTNILTAGDIATDTQVTIPITDGKSPRAALQRLIKNDRDYGYVVDANRTFKGIVSSDSLRELLDQEEQPHLIPNAYLDEVVTAHATDSMQDILPNVASHPWPLPILGESDKYLGAVSKNLFLRTLHRSEQETTEVTV